VHGAGYMTALPVGALTVMPSFSSWNGEKMTGNKSLLTGVLKDRWGFQGFTIGDWNAHGQVTGCTNEDCAPAINAGLDMFMYSGPKWKELYANTLREAKAGTIPAARLDDAVRRILRVKVIAGTFDNGRPSARPMSGKFALLGAPEHRAIARQAVRESLVLLKNNGGVLPVKPGANILVAGRGADNIGQQAGGWSITWQGTDVANKDFPNGQSIWSGIDAAARAAGGKATLAVDGAFAAKPDVAIVVFGETPYAEFTGDRPSLEYSPDDKSDLALLKKLKAAGVPTVAVFLSGRPMWVNPELNAADALVAAFLPGTEGGGVADVLVAGLPRQAELQLAQADRPECAQPHRFRLRPAVPDRLRPDLCRQGDARPARRNQAQGRGGRPECVVRPRPRRRGCANRHDRRGGADPHRPARAGGQPAPDLQGRGQRRDRAGDADRPDA
jgi:beta-glucosidase